MVAQASHKQRLKDLTERLGMEQLKLNKVLESTRTLKHLKASLHGVIFSSHCLACCMQQGRACDVLGNKNDTG